MKITDLLKPEGIKIGASAADQSDAIDQLVALQATVGNISDKDAYKEAILKREAEFSTAVGDGIAIPHAKTNAVKKAGLAAMTVKGGVDWNAADGKKSDLVFMIAAPEGEANTHLEILAKLAQMLMHKDFADALRAAKTPEDFLAVIDGAEAEKDAEAAAPAPAKSGLPDILAITACPTGIAHTYMAAENLEKKAAEMGLTLKAETQGSAGAKNVLTAEEIAHAKGIIIAADKNVDTSRFAGKQVYTTTVSAGINEPEKLISIINNNEAPIQEGTAASASAPAQKTSGWHTIYKHLMNGVSHMLPFVIGGGILTALAFLVDQPGLGTAAYGSSIPAAALFKTIGGEAFGLMLPILAGFIAMSIADRPGLAPGMVGGFFAKVGYDFAFLSTLDDTTLISGGFIAALFAGFAAGYIVLGLERLCDHLPNSLEGIKPMLIYPLLGTLIIGVIMLALNPIFAMINTALNGWLDSMGTANIVLLGAIVGGMMSIDFGGPINKAAYVFGTASLMDASGNAVSSGIMASVMVGGMVPPIALSISMLLFKGKYTPQERHSTITNFIMGLSFITEGAIPFAASDPIHVIPPCAIGAAVAGALSMLFGCALPAPHGGIFVFGVVTNWPMYLAALLIGSLVAAVLLGIFRAKRPQE